MACNCKRKIELEEKYGTKIPENIFQKINRFLIKIFFMVLAIVVTIIIVPPMVTLSFYKVFFGKNTQITLPNFLGKYLKNTNG